MDERQHPQGDVEAPHNGHERPGPSLGEAEQRKIRYPGLFGQDAEGAVPDEFRAQRQAEEPVEGPFRRLPGGGIEQ
jgi:hypothetical protein